MNSVGSVTSWNSVESENSRMPSIMNTSPTMFPYRESCANRSPRMNTGMASMEPMRVMGMMALRMRRGT